MNKLSLKAVTELLGITEHNLRAWERRYNAISPRRDESGRRVYSIEDVERLRLLIDLVNKGHAISNIASLNRNELEKLIQATAHISDNRQSRFPSNQTAQSSVEATLEAVAQAKWARVSHLLQHAELQYNTRQFLTEFVSPLLRQLGDRVEHQELDIFHEHALSALLRQQLHQLLFPLQPDGDTGTRDILVFATPEGEWHEFGILMAAVIANVNGFGVFYLGTNMPADSLARAAASAGAIGAVLGITSPTNVLPTTLIKKYLKQLDAALPNSCRLLLGGSRSSDENLVAPPLKIHLFQSLTDFDRHLQRLQSSPR